MDSRKYEKLIDLIINEESDKAKELFHEIVVEQSREIYESIMAEEMLDEETYEEEMGGSVGGLLDDITAEESGMTEEEEDFEDEEVFDLDDESEMDMVDIEDTDDGEDELEDAVVRIEDKLDQLMAEFEEIMGDMGGEEDMDMDMDMGDEEDMDMGDEEDMDDEGEEVMEAVQLQKVSPAKHGDDGSHKKSPVAANSGKAGMDSDVVNFSGGGDEKGRSAPQTKDVKGAGTFKNAPGGKAKVDLAAAPKPVTKDSSAGGKSPVAESRRTPRRPIR